MTNFQPAHDAQPRPSETVRPERRLLAHFLPHLALLALLSGLAGCQPDDAKVAATPPPRAVEVTTVAFGADRKVQTFAGVVKARIETDLAFRVGGKVLSRVVNVGDRVAAGEIIATLDDTDLKLELQSEEAELAAARSSLVQARADMVRVSTLQRQGWAASSTSGRQQAVTDEAAGRLAKAERAVDLAHDQLSYVTLRAQADGVVMATSIEAGQVVASGQPAIRVARLQEKEAAVSIPEAFVGEVRGAAPTVELWSQPGRVYKARLRELSPVADPDTRTFAARYAIEDAGEDVALGMTATVALAEGPSNQVARLPLSAVYDTGTGPGLWVVGADGHLTLKSIEISAYGADAVLVRSGVADGDCVVTLGVHKLDAKQQVRVVASID